MRFVYPKIDNLFRLSREDKVNVLIIENQKLFVEILTDINDQINGYEGKAVLSIDNIPCEISQNLELIIEFISIDINKKNLLIKLYKKLNEIAVNEKFFIKNKSLNISIIDFALEVSSELDNEFEFNAEIDTINIFKIIDFKFSQNLNLAEKLIEYFKIVREYDKEKCFILVNLRDYISFDEIDEFYKMILYNRFKVLIISGGDHPKSKYEEKIVIDEDLCQF